MTRRRVRLITQGNIIVARGWRVGEYVKDAGLKATHSASAGGWMLDIGRLPDLIAYLESRNIAATVEDWDDGGDAA